MNVPRNRLSDRILDAFDMACDQGDREVARELFRILEIVLTRRAGTANIDRRQDIADIGAATLRLDDLGKA
ncbi:MAG: hypothetical protein ACTSRY_08560 [Alphaproteobacteria bacterium]